MKECIKEVLGEMLRDLTYSQDEAPRLTKEVADRVKDRLKALELPRYKYMVGIQCHYSPYGLIKRCDSPATSSPRLTYKRTGPGRRGRAAGRGRAHGLPHLLGPGHGRVRLRDVHERLRLLRRDGVCGVPELSFLPTPGEADTTSPLGPPYR